MQKRALIAAVGMLLAISEVQAGPYDMDTNKPMGGGQEMGTAQAAVVISAPADGAVLAANQPVKVSYQATPGPKGNHIHLSVDGELVAIVPQLTGDYELKPLSPGKHKISIDIVTKSHQKIGVGKVIIVEAR